MAPRVERRTSQQASEDRELQAAEQARAARAAAPVAAEGPLGAGTATAVQPLAGVVTPNFVAAAAAMSIPNNGRTFVYVKNGATGATTPSVVSNATIDGDVIADKTFASQPISTERIYGPFNPGRYNFSDGTMELRFTATAGVTVGVFSLP